MTFSKERFDSCVTEAKRCMKDGIETEYDRAIFWANERIKELEKRIDIILKQSQPPAQPTEAETCKWRRSINHPQYAWCPHGNGASNSLEQDCPTCGKRIEVTS